MTSAQKHNEVFTLPATTRAREQPLESAEYLSAGGREELRSINVESCLAARAFQSDSSDSSLQNRLDPFAEAGLANVVGSLMDAWIAGPNAVACAIAAQRKEAASDLDQRVFAALIEGLLQFQVFFLHLGQIRLELQKTGVVSEQSLLSLEQLLHKSSGFFVDQGAVFGGTDSFGYIARSGD